jgi:V-type H+-transporting ATPase subunit H
VKQRLLPLSLETDLCHSFVAVCSTFDMYKKEVMSGKLQWSPVHKSEKFWKENAAHFEDNNNELLVYVIFADFLLHSDSSFCVCVCVCIYVRSRLKKILESGAESTTISVACFDIGEFARVHPRGRT